MRLGKHQLRLLAQLGSPFTRLIVGDDRITQSLVRRGLLAPRRPPKKRSDGKKDYGAFFGITPNGLRVLADAHELGLLEQFTDRRLHSDAEEA